MISGVSTTVYSCQSTCSTQLLCSGGCTFSNGVQTGPITITNTCCQTDLCNAVTTTTQATTTQSASLSSGSTITISVSLKVNLAFVPDFNNLTSSASLTFIQNYKTFVFKNSFSFFNQI